MDISIARMSGISAERAYLKNSHESNDAPAAMIVISAPLRYFVSKAFPPFAKLFLRYIM